MKQTRKGPSIRTKMTALTVSAIVVAMLVAVIIGVIFIKNIGDSSSKQMLLLLCKTGKKNLDAYFNSVEQWVEIVSAHITTNLDNNDKEQLAQNVELADQLFRENEADLAGVKLTNLSNMYGNVAKSLVAELKHGLKDKIILAYQPQYDYEGNCVGVEALLRYHHPLHGNIYPPLVVKPAEEGEFLPDLEEIIIERALADRNRLLERFGKGIMLSVNVTGPTVITSRFLQYCKKLDETMGLANLNLCLEVTEQAALSFSEESISIIKSLREMGLALAIDDFSMGKTSITYLKDNFFDEIKLDGSLVKGLSTHQNCREIILSITQLAASLNLTVIAEYVETEEEKEVLHEIGCDRYQGYLYSPAVFLDEQK